MATIEELEGVCWPEAGSDATYVMRRCLALRKKDVAAFSVEDLRVMLGQQIAVLILLSQAIQVLVEVPLADGDYYPGDLLHTVVQLPDHCWQGLDAVRGQLADVLAPLTESGTFDDHVRLAVSGFVTASRAD